MRLRNGRALVLAAVFVGLSGGEAFAQTSFLARNIGGSTFAESGSIPPDTMGAVGRDHYVELINGKYSVYRKSDGVRVQDSSLNAFYTAAGLTPTVNAFDPRVIFDVHSDRWFAVTVDNARQANRYLVAVSINSDPTAGWRAFGVDTDADDTRWADFPMLGLNANNLVISSNMFGVGSAPTRTHFTAISKAGLLTNTPSTASRVSFEDVDTNLTGLASHPAVDVDNGSGANQFLSSFNTSSLKRSTISGVGSGATLNTSGGFVAMPIHIIPPTAPQPDTPNNLNTGDARFSGSVVQNNGELWAVQTVSVNTRASLQWSRTSVATGALIASGTLSDPSLSLSFPSIAVNDFGKVVIGFSTSSATQYASANYVVGTYGATTVTLGAIQSLQMGSASYQRFDTSNRNRWGDYSATQFDPADPSIFWTTQLYANALDSWRTRIGEVVVPEVNEVRWLNPASGNYASGAQWFGGVAPGSSSKVIFSRSTTPGGPGYVVTLPGGTVQAESLLFRQGKMELNLGGGTLDLQGLVILGEYGGSPDVTISGGTLSSPDELIVGQSSLSPLSKLTIAPGTNVIVTSVGVGGDMGSTGGTATVTNNGSILTNSVRVWAGSTLTSTSFLDFQVGLTMDGVLNLNSGLGTLGDVTGNGSITVTSGFYASSTLDMGSLSFSGGTFNVQSSASTIELNELNMPLTGAVFNTGNNDLIVFAGALDDLGPLVPSGAILTVPDVGGVPTTMVLFEAGDLGLTEFNSIAVSADSVLGKFTYIGDSNLDGQVDSFDYSVIDDNFGVKGLGFIGGDMNLDGLVDSFDYSLIDDTFGAGVGNPLRPSQTEVFIPEPVSTAPLGLLLVGMARRRR